MTLGFDPSQQRTIRQVLEWYRFQAEVLGDELLRVQEILRNGGVPSNPRLGGMASEDIGDYFRFHRDELDFLVMLALMAAAEAEIRRNYSLRVDNRMKDPVSRAFLAIHRRLSQGRMHHRVNLDEDILDTWARMAPRTKRSVADFKGALNLRHWLAHGRYWDAKMGRPQYTPDDIYEISRNLLQAIA